METKSRDQAAGPDAGREPTEHRPVDDYLLAAFPWYGLDDAFTGPRWLMRVGSGADGRVEHGSLGHGDAPSVKAPLAAADPEPDTRRFAVVVTVAHRPGRRSADGTGILEATSVSSAAWLAGSGLLACTWPPRIARALRQDWMDQQTAIAWDLADDLSGPAWSSLKLPVDGLPTPFSYRESEYGWVLAGKAHDVHIGAYGWGMSADGIGFSVVREITEYRA
jgi:hypothetical protein